MYNGAKGQHIFMLTNVYGPIDNSHKIDFLNELRLIRQLNNLSWLVVGNFNLLRLFK